MPIYPTIPLTVPTVGGSSGAWGTILSAALLAVDSHNHLGVGSGGAQIVSAAININADLTFASFSATNLRSATFAAGQAVTGVRKLYVGADTELYWNNSAAGAAIKITDGTSLNVAGFIGGIGGDYTAVAAALNYDDSAKRYTLRNGGGTTWARVAAGEVRIHEHASTSSIYVALAAPAGIASPYTLTFPAAVPGSTQLAQVSSAGVVTFSNTVTNLITASAGVTCAANQHVTVSGTGDVKHGDREMVRHPSQYSVSSSVTATRSAVGISASAGADFWMAIPLRVGDRVKSIAFSHFGDGAADITVAEAAVVNMDGTSTSLGSTSVSNPAAAWATTTLNATDTTLATGQSLLFYVTTNAAGITLGNVAVTYDHP